MQRTGWFKKATCLFLRTEVRHDVVEDGLGNYLEPFFLERAQKKTIMFRRRKSSQLDHERKNEKCNFYFVRETIPKQDSGHRGEVAIIE